MDSLNRREVFRYISAFEEVIDQGDHVEIVKLLKKAIPSYSPSSTVMNGDTLSGRKHSSPLPRESFWKEPP